MTTSLYARLAARFPDPAKTFLKTPAGRTITYGDLEAESGRMAGSA
jgi:hypothetical protein